MCIRDSFSITGLLLKILCLIHCKKFFPLQSFFIFKIDFLGFGTGFDFLFFEDLILFKISSTELFLCTIFLFFVFEEFFNESAFLSDFLFLIRSFILFNPIIKKF